MKLRKRLSALIVSAALLLTALPAIAPATASAATTMGSIDLTIDSPTMTVNGTSKAIDAEGSKPTLDAGGYHSHGAFAADDGMAAALPNFRL